MQIRKRLTYANVASTLVVFLLIAGGTAFAASQLGKNSVGPKQLRKGSVNSAKVKDGSLRATDFAPNQLLAGPEGPRGPQGPSGTSHLFQANGSVNFEQFSSSLYGSQVVSLAVPPGSYYAIATVEVQTVNMTASSVSCRLINGNGGPGSSAVARTQIARADTEVDNMTLAAGFTVTSGQSLNLQCSKSVPGSSARVPEANIVAVGVSDVTGFP